MEHPKCKQIIVFNDNVFEVGDIVQIKKIDTFTSIKGRIREIAIRSFIVDTSTELHASCHEIRYADVASITKVSA